MTHWQKAVQKKRKKKNKTIDYNSAEKTQKDHYVVNTAIGPRVSYSC